MGEIQHAILRAHQHQTAQGQGRRGVIPAPVGGWNTQDPEASMDPSFGTQMENYFPERGRVISAGAARRSLPIRPMPGPWKRCSTGYRERPTSCSQSPEPRSTM